MRWTSREFENQPIVMVLPAFQCCVSLTAWIKCIRDYITWRKWLAVISTLIFDVELVLLDMVTFDASRLFFFIHILLWPLTRSAGNSRKNLGQYAPPSGCLICQNTMLYEGLHRQNILSVGCPWMGEFDGLSSLQESDSSDSDGRGRYSIHKLNDTSADPVSISAFYPSQTFESVWFLSSPQLRGCHTHPVFLSPYEDV